MEPLHWRGFYAILDIGVVGGRDPIEVARKLLAARPVALQLRAKEISPKEILSLAYQLAPLCQAEKIPFVMNDRADIAALCGAWGVHLGQEDLSLPSARRSFSNVKIGVSTHSLEQLQKALWEGADYVGFGPVFATSTKQNPDPVVGVSLLAEAVQIAGAIPVVAIGGIKREHLPSLVSSGARVVTAISDVLLAEDPTEVVIAYQEALRG